VFDTITTNTLLNFVLYLPPLPIQKKIADILSIIDEKIETLQNINSTLEEMAKAIFKSWFVDFEIVQAKQSGKSDSEIAKEFGISKEIVRLFPSEFETSEIGKIPKGWGVKKLGEFFPIITGKKNANIASKNGKYNFFTCSQDILKCDTYSFDDSAILLAGNGDFNIKWFRGKFEAYQRTYVLIPYEKNNLGYLFFTMKHFLNLITSSSQGSVIKFITKGMIENFKIVYPQNEFFISFFTKILDNIENNTQQIQTLQELRDTLLPKLINGEIEVEKLDIKGIENGFN
jgi:type I restriction enzyme S subunit